MTPQERIQTELTAAMRSGDVLRRDVLRMTQSALYNVEKAQRRPLTEDEQLAVLARELKTRRESIEAFRAGGRPDLAEPEEAAVAILADFLPAPLTEEEVRSLVDEAVVAVGASSARDMGKVMGWLAPRTRGRADGRRVSELAAQALAQADLAGHDPKHGT